MDGIFCANFCESRGSWPACQKVWHAKCYNCLGEGKFLIRAMKDKEGNIWYKEEQRAQRLNQGVRGAHVMMPFQCEDCWMVNLEGRYPVPGLDEAYVMCLHRAYLDAAWVVEPF